MDLAYEIYKALYPFAKGEKVWEPQTVADHLATILPPSTVVSKPLADILDELNTEHYIMAIKVLRNALRLNLSDAKAFVDVLRMLSGDSTVLSCCNQCKTLILQNSQKTLCAVCGHSVCNACWDTELHSCSACADKHRAENRTS